MAVNRSGVNVGYGLTNALQDLAPQPIVSQRDPLPTDRAELGTIWVNPSDETYFVATAVANNQTTWQASNGGAGIFSTLEVTGTSDLDGDVTMGAALEVTGDITAGNDVNVTGIVDAAVLVGQELTVNGDSSLLGAVELGTSGIGEITVDPSVTSTASTTPTNNGNVCRITITGLTTASGATQVITISNNQIIANSGIFVSAYNLNASTNNALIGIKGTVVAVGSIAVSLINNGAGALGAGDDVVITLWVIS